MSVRWDAEDSDVAYVPSSRPPMVYRIDNARSLTPRCTCQAGRWGRDCRHVADLLEALLKLGEGEDMARKKEEGTLRDRLGVPETPEGAQEAPRALVPRPKQTVAARVVAARDALAATRAGVADAREIAMILRPVWPEELIKRAEKDEEAATGSAIVVVMTAVELGIAPMQAFSYITSIRGKPFLMARMVSAMVGSRVPGGYITIIERTPLRATGIGHRPGRPDVKLTITMDDAIKAKWPERNPNYRSNPAAMLVARVTTTIGWIQFSDVLAGMDVYNDEVGEEMYAQDSEFATVVTVEDPPEQPEPQPLAQEEPEEPAEAEYTEVPEPDEEPELPLNDDEEAEEEFTEDDAYAQAFLVLGEVAVELNLEKPMNSGHINTALQLKQSNQKGLREALFEWAKNEGKDWPLTLKKALLDRYGQRQ